MNTLNTKTYKNKGSLTLIALVALITFVGCSSVDVVKKYSRTSLDALLDYAPEIISDTTEIDHYYNLSVDGQTVFHISHDYKESGNNDIMISTPIQPFLDAGLDVTQLSTAYRTDTTHLFLASDFGDGKNKHGDGVLKTEDVINSLFEAVEFDRLALSYHEEMDHYGIEILNGKFEYAKDYTTNDKDIVFILAASPLAEAGVDVTNIEGWIFKTLDNPDGTTFDVLLKPFDL